MLSITACGRVREPNTVAFTSFNTLLASEESFLVGSMGRFSVYVSGRMSFVNVLKFNVSTYI